MSLRCALHVVGGVVLEVGERVVLHAMERGKYKGMIISIYKNGDYVGAANNISFEDTVSDGMVSCTYKYKDMAHLKYVESFSSLSEDIYHIDVEDNGKKYRLNHVLFFPTNIPIKLGDRLLYEHSLIMFKERVDIDPNC